MAIVFSPRLLLPPLTHDQRFFFILFSFLLALAIQVADRPYGVVTSFARCAMDDYTYIYISMQVAIL
jgi:hypothetical protein